ncbi:hypothetical protein PP451_18130 [Mycobacteroides abscessus]|nr:hypothetical protein [Mycobacteroides abscessus]MDE9371577.1 hypothetical protein [Mycobacteroides abscessus subsp. bolletii]MDM2097054.1 hypothetical protein [Mycobacteroides abscessus]MDM2121358.1 hypothetical protein [Mycobacteroides abscessus]MDM2124518.1 hypothetical protein [Mycobacteroides abscessus]MDM2130934.1 hypothetical protein [Mycobacteroides abscessus]
MYLYRELEALEFDGAAVADFLGPLTFPAAALVREPPLRRESTARRFVLPGQVSDKTGEASNDICGDTSTGYPVGRA